MAKCSGQRWLTVSPPADAEFHYGASSGRTTDEAVLQAKRALAEAIASTLSSTITDTQQLTDRALSPGARLHAESTEVRSEVKLTVDQRLRECSTREVCGDQDSVHALVACNKRSPLERELIRAAHSLAAETPHDGTVLAVPGVELPNTITALSEYASASIADRIPSGGDGARIVPVSNWAPTALREAAKRAGAKYLLRTEYRQAGEQRLHFSAFVQDAETLARVGEASSFDADLEPWQLRLLSPIGSLEPAAASGGAVRGVLRFAMNKTDLRDGDEAVLSYTLSEDSYVYIYDIYEDGRIALLFPNHLASAEAYLGGRTYSFPDARQKGAGLRLIACSLPGKKTTREAYRIVASPTPLELPGTATFATNLQKGGTQGGRGDLDSAIRELLTRGAKLSQQDVQFAIEADPKGPCPK